MADAPVMTDEELVRSVLDHGCTDAFDLLVRRHLSRIRGMVFNMVSNQTDTDDLVQEIFLRAYRKLATFNHRATFSTWLFRIAINTVRSHQRHSYRDPVLSFESPPAAVSSHLERPDAQLRFREMNGDIQRALERLTPKLKRAIVCHVIEGLSIPAIAVMEGCSQATVYWRIHFARKTLKRALAEYL